MLEEICVETQRDSWELPEGAQVLANDRRLIRAVGAMAHRLLAELPVLFRTGSVSLLAKAALNFSLSGAYMLLGRAFALPGETPLDPAKLHIHIQRHEGRPAILWAHFIAYQHGFL